VLIIGQVPPPHHGQAVMIKQLLDAPMPGIERNHVDLSYSRALEETGQFKLRKVCRLASVILKTLWALARRRPDVVYYPPAGPMWVPVVRDIVTLLAIRPFSRRMVFHFHGVGLSALWLEGIRSRVLRFLFRRAYFGADLAIMLAPSVPDDGKVLRARRRAYVPNGIPDAAAGYVTALERRRPGPLRILFVGAVTEPKGVFVLTEAASRLWYAGFNFRLQLMGSCEPTVRRAIEERAGPHSDRLDFLDVLVGSKKWRTYASTDVFSLPTHYEAEGLPLVCLEAMAFGVPVVATRWRGIPDMVTHEETGLLVRPEDPEDLSRALRRLLSDDSLRHDMGERGRRRYEAEFTLERWTDTMRDEVLRVAS